LPLAMQLALSASATDFHRLVRAHAGHTQKNYYQSEINSSFL